MKNINFLWIVLGIVLAELILTISYPIGFVIYAIVVGAILIFMENDISIEKDEKLLIFLMIIPICRIAELFFNFNFFWNTFIFYLLVISLSVYYAIKLKIKSNPYIGNPLYFVVLVVISGILSAVAKNFFNWSFSYFIFLIPVIAYAEEVFFRGGLQNISKEFMDSMSILFVSMIYMAFSLSYGFSFALIAFFASLVISTVYYFTKNLYLTFVLNIILHILLFIFYPVFL